MNEFNFIKESETIKTEGDSIFASEYIIKLRNTEMSSNLLMMVSLSFRKEGMYIHVDVSFDNESYGYIDLLIADQVEAFRLTGEQDPLAALRFFGEKKVSSSIITNGSKPVSIYSDGKFFNYNGFCEMPVSRKVTDELRNTQGGDTTGCGDNFAGGILASVVSQLRNGTQHPDLMEVCSWGVVSGGFACFYLGGTYFEEKAGEKKAKMKPYYDAYRKQLQD